MDTLVTTTMSCVEHFVPIFGNFDVLLLFRCSLRNNPCADTRVCSTMLRMAHSFAIAPGAASSATHAMSKSRVVVVPRVIPTNRNRVFRKYLPTPSPRGASGRGQAARVVVSAVSTTSGASRGDWRRQHRGVRREAPSVEASSSEFTFATAREVLRSLRKALFAFITIGLAFAFSPAAPALAFSFGKSADPSSLSASATAYAEPAAGSWSSKSTGPWTLHKDFGSPASHPAIHTMKNLPVPVGDIGSIGMLTPAGMGIPYHGNNPGIALFMASGGVTIRMLINVVVIYMIYKYWMTDDE